MLADVLDDLRVREGGHVADVGEVGDRGDDPAHDLAGAGLGHVRDDPDVLGPGDLADLGVDRLGHLLLEVLARRVPRLQRDVHLDRPAEDPEVAIGRLDSAVAGEVRPVAPVLALSVAAVLLVVGLHEPIGLAPDCLEDPGPGVADADVAGTAAPGRHDIALFVVDHRIDPEHPGPAAAGLHRLQGGQGAAQEAAVLGLPSGIDDDRLALAHDTVVPAPYIRLDRLAHRRHVLEVVVVLLRLFRAELAQHADGRGRGVEDVHPQPLGDPPGTAGIRIDGYALVHHAGRPQRQGAVDDVGVPGDPADVSEAPVGVLRVDVLVVL